VAAAAGQLNRCSANPQLLLQAKDLFGPGITGRLWALFAARLVATLRTFVVALLSAFRRFAAASWPAIVASPGVLAASGFAGATGCPLAAFGLAGVTGCRLAAFGLAGVTSSRFAAFGRAAALRRRRNNADECNHHRNQDCNPQIPHFISLKHSIGSPYRSILNKSCPQLINSTQFSIFMQCPTRAPQAGLFRIQASIPASRGQSHQRA